MARQASGIAREKTRQLKTARDAAAQAYRKHVKGCGQCSAAKGNPASLCTSGYSLIRGVTAAVKAVREDNMLRETGQDILW